MTDWYPYYWGVGIWNMPKDIAFRVTAPQWVENQWMMLGIDEFLARGTYGWKG